MNPEPTCSTCPPVDPLETKSLNPLKRGKACVVCRTLKIKCDGIRPVCGSCQRRPKGNKCNWDDYPNRSRVAILIATIKSLEARIFELEHPELVAPVTLHYPYSREEEHSSTHLSVEAPIPISAFPVANFSSDCCWETAINASVSSIPPADSETFAGYPMEFGYAPLAPPSANASRYYQYRRDSESYTTNTLMQPGHT